MLIGAHPDDCEYRCGGVAALWAQRGHRVSLVSVTNGQSGHHEQGGSILAQRRIAEARAAAEVIGAESLVLPIPDGQLEPTLVNRLMLIRVIRRFQADLIITNRPNDYHPDHRYTSQLVQDSAFLLTVPHIAPEVPALRDNPVVLYWSDPFQKPIPFDPQIAIDIDGVLEKKVLMLHRHTSQMYEWLPWLDHALDRVPADDSARRQWLAATFLARERPSVAERFRGLLVERYGQTRGADIQNAEAFEVCEYGAPLDEAGKERFFGGL